MAGWCPPARGWCGDGELPAATSKAQGVCTLIRIEGVGGRAQANPAHLGDLRRIRRRYDELLAEGHRGFGKTGDSRPGTLEQIRRPEDLVVSLSGIELGGQWDA